MRPTPAVAHQTEQGQLLLYPEADGEALLGRAVQMTKDGGSTIAETRAPGCEVAVRHEHAEFRSTRKLDLGSMTTLAGSYAKLVSLAAKFGNKTIADIEVSNREILRADMRGPCGDVVIDTVFVGHGSRKITRTSAAAVSGSGQVGLVSVAPGVDTSSTVLDAIDWKEDQAYGFAFRKQMKEEALDVGVTIPSIVFDGEEVEIGLQATRGAWVVVYMLGVDGRVDVLWPSAEEPEPHVLANTPLVLPSKREKALGYKLRAALAQPGQRTRETLVVYGFADKRDFDAMKPSVGGSGGTDVVADLTRRLHAVPMARWSRTVAGYAIEPKR